VLASRHQIFFRRSSGLHSAPGFTEPNELVPIWGGCRRWLPAPIQASRHSFSRCRAVCSAGKAENLCLSLRPTAREVTRVILSAG
jgi:hypothetical protein